MSGAASGRRDRRSAWLDLLWTMPFLMLYWVQLAHPLMWRDESNAEDFGGQAGGSAAATFAWDVGHVHIPGF